MSVAGLPLRTGMNGGQFGQADPASASPAPGVVPTSGSSRSAYTMTTSNAPLPTSTAASPAASAPGATPESAASPTVVASPATLSMGRSSRPLVPPHATSIETAGAHARATAAHQR